MKNIQKILILTTFVILASFLIFAADFTPQGNINLRDVYNITGVPEYDGENINITGNYYGNGSQLTGILAISDEANLNVSFISNFTTVLPDA